MTDQRDRIRSHLRKHPGTHVSGLVRALDLAPGQVQHHLRILRRRDAVVAEALYGRTHYFTPEYDERERGKIAVLRRETARDVLVRLLESGPAAPQAVADDLEIVRSTLEWHLDRLVEQDLVAKRRDDRNRVELVVHDEAEALELLAEVVPNPTARMVDRFERLVDDLFEG